MIKDPCHLRESVDDAIRSSVNYAVNASVSWPVNVRVQQVVYRRFVYDMFSFSTNVVHPGLDKFVAEIEQTFWSEA